MSNREVDCTVCGSSDFGPYFVEDGHTIVRCKSCKHVYENPVSFQETHVKYEESGGWIDNSFQLESDFIHHPRGMIYRDALQTMKKYNLSGGRILEIGCSAGHFLKFMQQNGYEAWGVEPGTDSLIAGKIDGVHVERSFIEEFETDKKFQGIFLFDVLEHIPNPNIALEIAYKYLDNKGIIYAVVPNFNLQKIRVLFARVGLRPFKIVLSAGNHINHFSPKNLENFILQQPFDRVAVKNGPIDLQYIRGLPFWWKPFKKFYWQIANFCEKLLGVRLAGSIVAVCFKA